MERQNPKVSAKPVSNSVILVVHRALRQSEACWRKQLQQALTSRPRKEMGVLGGGFHVRGLVSRAYQSCRQPYCVLSSPGFEPAAMAILLSLTLVASVMRATLVGEINQTSNTTVDDSHATPVTHSLNLFDYSHTPTTPASVPRP